MVISNGKPCVGVVLVMLLEDIIASVWSKKESKFPSCSWTSILMAFTDHVFVPMSTLTCCQKTTAFWYVLVTTDDW